MMSGFLGSEKPIVSKGMEEIIPDSPKDWTEQYSLVELQVNNQEDCTFLINGETKVFSYAGEGLYIGKDHPNVTSLIIIEPEINYTWMGVY